MTTQKDQLLSGSSPTAIVVGQKPAPAGAAAPAAETTAAPVVATLPNPPEPGAKCQTCGQVMPDDGDKPDPDAASAAAAAVAAATQTGAYTIEMATETMNLCAIAKVPLGEAKAFIDAKTPIAAVRTALTSRAAAAADALSVDGTAKPTGQAEASVAAAWDAVVTEQNAKLAQNTKR